MLRSGDRLVGGCLPRGRVGSKLLLAGLEANRLWTSGAGATWDHFRCRVKRFAFHFATLLIPWFLGVFDSLAFAILWRLLGARTPGLL